MRGKLALGKQGEQIATEHLKFIGYKIIALNWRRAPYEIDIVALDDLTYVFVEVKLRTSAIDSVNDLITPNKQNALIEGANIFMQELENAHNCRIDIITVVKKSTYFKINHLIDAIHPSF